MSRDTKNILRFILKVLLMMTPIVVPALLFYIIADPFKAVRQYEVYYPAPDVNPVRVGLNKGVVTIADYKQRTAIGHRYDSFIFGSSISCFYDADEWKRCLGDESAEVFHFDSSGESIEQMSQKVNFLDKSGAKLRHALVVLDPIIMGNATPDGPAFVSPPEFNPSLWHWAKYHYTFFRASTNADFFKNYLPALVYGRPFDIAHNQLFETQPIVYNPLRNQESLPAWDKMISENPDSFYVDHPLIDSPDTLSVSASIIDDNKKRYLQLIASVFEKHHTDFRIVVGANRRMITLNPADKATLESVFGRDRVYDLSRSMAPFLKADTMLYDNTHYRPTLATMIMHEVYSDITNPSTR